MNNRKYLNKRGFALVDIAISLIVVGAVVTTISATKSLIRGSKLSNAKLITSSSPVPGIDSLVAWYEPVLKDSFDSDDINSPSLEVNKWYDSNPQTTNPKDLVVSTSDGANSKPLYVRSGINDIPSLTFGADITDNTLMEFPEINDLLDTYYTIFVVHKKTGSNPDLEGIIDIEGVSSAGIIMGYNSNADFGLESNDDTDNYYNIASSLNKVIITTSGLSPNGVFLYENGELKRSPDGANGKFSQLNRNAGNTLNLALKIGKGYKFFHGMISEVIIFNEELSILDRESVENYLSEKYNVQLNRI